MNSRMAPDYAVPDPSVIAIHAADLEPFRQRVRTLPGVARHKLRIELQRRVNSAACLGDRRYYEQVIDVLHDAA